MKLATYAELLRIEHKHKDVDGFIETLVLMMLIMRGTVSIRSISDRMISSGSILDPQRPLWEDLRKSLEDPDKLVHIARQLQSPFIQSMHIEGV